MSPTGPPAHALALYEALVASEPGLERKGATTPYTSVNGNMFSFLSPEGAVALRLGKADREAFIATYATALHEAHGRVMKEYVTVPDDLLARTGELTEYFAKSYAYAQQLKPKATKRKPKPSSA
jgi:TfoX/Sxy family transcriptional regulator of competence genes